MGNHIILWAKVVKHSATSPVWQASFILDKTDYQIVLDLLCSLDFGFVEIHLTDAQIYFNGWVIE